MLIMVVATTATTVASPDRWKLPTLEWKAPTQAPQSRRDGRRRRTTTDGSIVRTWDQDERSENSGLFYCALLWVTSVNNSGGWFWWNRKTWTNEDLKKQWHKLDHWFVGLISSKHQGNYEIGFITIAFKHFVIQGNFLLHPWTQPKPLDKRLIDVWQYAQLRSMISNRQPAHCWSMFDNLCIDNRWSIFDNQRLMINIWQGALSWKQLIFGSKAKSLKGEGCKVSQSLSSGKGARNEACPTLRVWLLLNSSKEICSVSIVERSCFAKMDLKNEMETGFYSIDEMRVRTFGLSSFTPALGQRST